MVQFENFENSENPELDLDEPLVEQKESIKLMKNTKGYNWDIKLLGNPIADETLSRLEQLNNHMKEKYGRDSNR